MYTELWGIDYTWWFTRKGHNAADNGRGHVEYKNYINMGLILNIYEDVEFLFQTMAMDGFTGTSLMQIVQCYFITPYSLYMFRM